MSAPKIPTGVGSCHADGDLRVWEDWEPRLQLEINLKIVDNGVKRFVIRKQLQTKKFSFDEALFLFHEKCQLVPLLDVDQETLHKKITAFETKVQKEDDRKESRTERKEVGRAARKTRLETAARIEDQRKRGYSLFDVYDESGQIIDEPFVELSAAEKYLAKKGQR